MKSDNSIIGIDAGSTYTFAKENERVIGYFPDSDVDGWLLAIEKLKELAPQQIMGGYGKQYKANSYETTENHLPAVPHTAQRVKRPKLLS